MTDHDFAFGKEPNSIFKDLNLAKPKDLFSNNENIIEDLNSLKDKNDNLEVQLAAKQVCRTCFNIIEGLSYIGLNEDIEMLINRCLPKVKLKLTINPVICQKCVIQLEEFYNFLINCMKIEEELLNYCNYQNDSNPINIHDFLKKRKLITNFVDVKKEEQKEEDSDNDNIKDKIDNISNESFSLKNESENENLENDTLKKSETKVKIRVRRKHFLSKDLLENQVKCEECGKKFKSKWALSRHIPVHKVETNSAYNCNVCNLKFRYKSSYKKHIAIHLSGAPINKPFACECGKYFSRWAKLKKHKEVHRKKEKPFACKECGKRFTEQQLLDSHVERVHKKEKPFSCEICSNKYTSKSGLDVHVKTHYPSKNPRPLPDLMCDVCGKLFARKYSLEKHRMSHTGDKPHQCEQCNMKFKERYQLTIHQRRHTGEKPFNCEVCGFKFPSKNRLGVHMRIHTGVRPFSCNFCEMAFTRNDHLIKHVRAIHTGERPFECEICNKNFNRKDYLLKHKKVHLKASI